jgi:hypothetical protein
MNRQRLIDQATDTVLTKMFFVGLHPAETAVQVAREQMTLLRQAAKDDPQGTCHDNELQLNLCGADLNYGLADLVLNIDYHINTLVDFGSELLEIPVE